jgi:hypothetical protein
MLESMTARAARRMLGESREELSYDDVGARFARLFAPLQAVAAPLAHLPPPSALLPRSRDRCRVALARLPGRCVAFCSAARRSRARRTNRTSPAARRRAEIVPKRVAAGTIAARMAEAPADPGQPSRA